ncbi:MAG: DUF6063 family protein [Bacteroidales bacterium]|nr:DUF6063 family protein [Clostridium sp.]MCM1204032.1 DUF6063 family protein [Bacteroidales bacterium]
MEMKNLEKAMDIYAKLITGEDISRSGANGSLYDDYYGNAEVYEIVGVLLKKLNLNLYEYKESLFLSAGDGNRIFGYTNEELKKNMGLRYNKELYLCYFIMYEILLLFYSDSAAYQFKEYIRIEQVMEEVTKALSVFTGDIAVYAMEEERQESFKTVALLWDELPASTGQEQEDIRASKASKAGMVKLTFNFLVGEKLFVEVSKRYYPTERFKAVVENYFEEYRGEIYAALSNKTDIQGDAVPAKE